MSVIPVHCIKCMEKDAGTRPIIGRVAMREAIIELVDNCLQTL